MPTYKVLDNKHLEITETIESVRVVNKKALEDERKVVVDTHDIRIAEIDEMLIQWGV